MQCLYALISLKIRNKKIKVNKLLKTFLNVNVPRIEVDLSRPGNDSKILFVTAMKNTYLLN